MKIQVTQVRERCLNEFGHLIPKSERPIEIKVIGTVQAPDDSDESILNSIWDLFNWSCWGDPELDKDAVTKGITKGDLVMHQTSDAKGVCNSDIYLQLNGHWYVAESVGWKILNSEDECRSYLISKIKYYR